MEYLDLTLSLYGCVIFLAVFLEAVVQGLRKGQYTGWLFGCIPAVALSVFLSIIFTVPFRLQLLNPMFSAMQAQIPWYIDSFCVALIISRGSSWVHEKANNVGMNRNCDGSRIV